MRISLSFAAIVLALVLAGCASSLRLDPSARSFVLSGWGGPDLRVFAVEPEGIEADAPVVVVLHGARRNAREYRDNWIDLARQYRIRVYVPEFSRRHYRTGEDYTLGGVSAAAPASKGSYDAIEPLFDHVRAERGVLADDYVLFGHSAGAQFVHRFICLEDAPRLGLAIAANAGWYTLPDPNTPWPYGLMGIETNCLRENWVQRPLLILLGEADNDPQAEFLRRTPEADLQGLHRLARGHTFLSAGRDAALEHDVELGWRLRLVPGVAHDNAAMAVAAMAEIAGGPVQ